MVKSNSKVIEEVVAQVAGSDVVPLVKILKNKKNVSEFKLADDMKQEVNATRNMLYRLYNSNLVSFIRKKDKKKGWYIYYWTFDANHINYLVKVLGKKRLEQIKERLKREEEGQFYMCPNKCMRLDFDQAANFQFKCPECGQLVNHEDNSALKESLRKEVAEIEQELAEGLKVKEEKQTEKPKKKKIIKKKLKKRIVKKKIIKTKKSVKKKPKKKKRR